MVNLGVRPRLVHEALTQRGVAHLVQHSGAVGFVDSQVVLEVGPDRLRTIALEPSISWPIHLIHSREQPNTKVFQSFLAWLETREEVA